MNDELKQAIGYNLMLIGTTLTVTTTAWLTLKVLNHVNDKPLTKK